MKYPPLCVTITSIGSTPLTIASVLPSAEFSETDNCITAALARGVGCVANVTFTPANSGSRTGSLTITSNSKGSPQVVPLTGIGGDFSLAPSSGSALTATVSAGSTATYTVELAALNYQGSVTLLCLGAPANGTCTAKPGSATMTGNNSTNVTVTVKTTAVGTANLAPSGGPRFPVWPWLPGVSAMPLLPSTRRDRTRKTKRDIGAMVRVCGLMLLTLLCACGLSSSGGSGGSSPPSGTPQGSYQLMLVGASVDGLQRSVEMTLQVH